MCYFLREQLGLSIGFGVGAAITCESGGTRVGFVNPEVGEAGEADMIPWLLEY